MVASAGRPHACERNHDFHFQHCGTAQGSVEYVLLMNELLNRSTNRSDLQQSSEFP